MTEKLLPLPTQVSTPSQNLLANVPSSTHDAPHKVETVEEEPYTIKCICNFSDDDGNTIYCETCDTWQHIDCFYPDSREEALREDFDHSCADCKPRPLDRQKAIERTQRLKQPVQAAEATDKKPKRPPSKSHKKKPKPTDLQLNGQPNGQDHQKHGSPSDHSQPNKKAKSSHRPSHSISSQAAKRSPSYSNPRPTANGHPPSPATTPPDLPSDFEIHNYSANFLSLYNEQDAQIVQNNSFASLTVSNTMSLWVHQPDRLREDTGEEFSDVFQPLPADIDTRKPIVDAGQKTTPLGPDTVLRWRYLATTTAVEKDIPLLELNGQIGFQKDYCADPASLWEELSSPLPFVFFHPMLPLCIDTRKEGSLARYVRRSCKPNAVLDTYLIGGSGYRFWLVSDRHLAAGEQITLPWDFRLPKKAKARMLHFIGIGDEEPNGITEEYEMDEAEYQRISGWVHRILSEYGGCACDLGNNCAFARFHRLYHGKMQARSTAPKKKSRKPKSHTISPTSTGHATNSRAPSEGHADDGADNDASVSDASRSKPPSRDLTPLRQGSFDQLGILTEPTDRDKRKVQMVEDSFRRMEQQQQPPRKKKRISDGTGSKSKPKSTSAAANAPVSNGAGHYVDVGTSRSKSASPSSAVSPHGQNPFRAPAHREGSVAEQQQQRSASASGRSNYCDAAIQTDPVQGEWYSEPSPTPTVKRRIISLSQRLLNNRYRLRCDEEGKKCSPSPITETASLVPMDIDSTSDTKAGILDSPTTGSKEWDAEHQQPSPGLPTTGDVPMSDAPVSASPTLSRPQVPTLVTTGVGASGSLKVRSPDLRVQMPAVPSFASPSSTISTATTPLSASGSMVQSPFSNTLQSPFAPPSVNGVAAHPSPVKKKLSLSDYTKSRMNKAAAGKPPGSLKVSASTLEDGKTAGGLEAIIDSPTAEKSAEASHPASGNPVINGIPATAASTTAATAAM